jgi:hypothetical protein
MLEELYKVELNEVTLWEYRQALSGKGYILRREKDKGTAQQDEEATERLYDEYLKRFGLGDDYQDCLDIQLELIDLYGQFIESDNAFLRNKIRHLETQLAELMDKESKGDLDDALVIVSKWMKTVLNEREITAMFFFKALDNFMNEQNRIKQSNNGEEQD